MAAVIADRRKPDWGVVALTIIALAVFAAGVAIMVYTYQQMNP